MTDRFNEYARPAEGALSLFQRLHLGLLTLLVTACGALSAAAWQAVERSAGNEAAHDRELKDFHARLVHEMRRLAENSGMMTSADLCPVRIRLRMPDGWNHPIREIRGQLVRTDQPGAPSLLSAGADGVLSFGLVPPGRYRLDLKDVDGRQLVHEFEVLPGVPVDRLILCPKSVNTPHLTTRIQLVLPSELQGESLAVCCYVESDDLQAGEWTWRPGDREGAWVAGTIGARRAEFLEDLSVMDALLGEPVLPASSHRHARCTAIAVFRRRTADRGVPEFIGTFRFQTPDDGAPPDGAPGDGAPADGDWPQPVFHVDGPAPTHVRPIHNDEAEWMLELPQEICRACEAGLRARLGRGSTTGRPTADGAAPRPVDAVEYIAVAGRRKHLSDESLARDGRVP